MSSSQDICAAVENSTDCLLRALLDALNSQNDAFSWDPLNFVFTLIIGLVALLFAAITIIQGVLSAGEGLRKCSRNAIGPWSSKTERHWNWSELRRDSIAYTPVLARNVFLARLESGSLVLKPTKRYLKWSNYARYQADAPTPSVAVGSKTRVRSSENYCVAPWLQFLNSLELGEFIWEQFQQNTKATAADYLPTEIQAIPAFASVGCIIVLAAVAGCDELATSPESGYPLMAGSNLQVRFRHDPFLGTVATFERYDMDAVTFGGPPLGISLKSAILNSRGDFQTRFGRIETEDSFINVVGNVSETFKVTPSNETEITGPGLLRNRNECSAIHEVEQLCRSWHLLLNMASRHNFAWLLYAEWPFYPPLIFPARLAAVAELIDAITLQSPFWSRICSTDPRTHLLHVGDWRNFWSTVGREPGRASWEAFALCLHFVEDASSGGRVFKRLPRDTRFGLRMTLIDQMKEVDHALLAMDSPLESVDCQRVELYMMTAAIRDLGPLRQIQRRIEIPVKQTPELGHGAMLELPVRGGRVTSPAMDIMEDLVQFFNITGYEPSGASHGGRHNSARSTPLDRLQDQVMMLLSGGAPLHNHSGEVSNVLLSLYKLVKSLEPRNVDPVDPHADTRTHLDDGGPIGLLRDQVHPVQQLLIYRAVLLGVICLTAVDNSDFFDSGIASQIVRVL